MTERQQYPTYVRDTPGTIIGSLTPLTVGSQHKGLRNDQGPQADQPFVVIRECSFDEWHAWLLTRLAPGDELAPHVLDKGRQEGMRFYEVSTD